MNNHLSYLNFQSCIAPMDFKFGYVVVQELRNNFHEDNFAIRATEDDVILKSYRSLYVDSLLDFPNSNTALEQELIHISFKMTLQQLSLLGEMKSNSTKEGKGMTKEKLKAEKSSRK
ncbi:carbon catabolite repressor protein 4 1-like [Pyrus ussuriensis x Pyrus communis]|uniref:Carbon catabolite repressor protein 4 1-like n=1 Tax=Pyrus ussuriensis x Pyrus communis TaxID=2448454 RepID=A0A5N5HLX8_9ROSA|nr:carbon catabolite repressor protein 4 1-like [Pyrus ussuriensis x Pyrus communis]